MLILSIYTWIFCKEIKDTTNKNFKKRKKGNVSLFLDIYLYSRYFFLKETAVAAASKFKSWKLYWFQVSVYKS